MPVETPHNEGLAAFVPHHVHEAVVATWRKAGAEARKFDEIRLDRLDFFWGVAGEAVDQERDEAFGELRVAVACQLDQAVITQASVHVDHREAARNLVLASEGGQGKEGS